MNKLTVGFITTLSERLQLIVQLRLRYTCFIWCGLICPLLLLTNILIIFLQDEVSAQIPGAFDNPNNAVRIHHSLASIASDYRFEITANNTSLSADVKFVVLPSFYVFLLFRKKEYVFRLRTADQAEFLFQTSDEQELRAWVDTINTVVAR